jgi:hypothetical protein
MLVNTFTREEESTEYFNLFRPLVSPYSRLAGGLTLSRNYSYNVYHAPDSVYYLYKYRYFDAWAGYNIGLSKLTETNNTIRDRRFLAFRYYDRTYEKVPEQIGYNFNPVFNNSRAVLGQFTFFRQDYYKTQYIYGFGTTEDLPYGYNVAITGGWHQQLGMERPYAGLNASEYIATGGGDFIQLYMKTGAFLHKNKIQDGSFLLGATAYSRLMFLNSTKIRQYANLSYAALYDRVTSPLLYINNYYGLRGFLSDSAYGARRLSLQLETVFYLKYKLFGFQFAPFPWADFTVLTPEGAAYRKSSLYSSLGAGLRMRNENLVFETIEMRAFFFPIAPDHMRDFKVVTTARIRFRYRSNYITEPDLVQLNNE